LVLTCIKKIRETSELRIVFIYEINKELTKGLDKSILVDDPENLLERKADLVVEAALLT
jgi:hypothetical protein